MKLIKNFVILLAVVTSMTFCSRNDVYFEYKAVPSTGWEKDSLLSFNIPISDTLSQFNVFVHVRHYGVYPYQNLWLFMDFKGVRDTVFQKDTIGFYLADEYGKWLGTGAGAIKEMPVYFKQNIQFPDSGIYQIRIRQGMRDSALKGVNNVGIRVEKVINP